VGAAHSELTRQTPCTLLYMVEEKERLLRAHGLDDPFLGLKQDENQVSRVALANPSRSRRVHS
jgi:hypothetical protein